MLERVKAVAIKLVGWFRCRAADIGFVPGGLFEDVPKAWIANEITSAVLPFMLGAILVLDWRLGSRWAFWFGLCCSLVLAITTVIRSLGLRLLSRLYSKLGLRHISFAEGIADQNLRLLRVALAAEAVRATIEAGYNPNIGPLTRSLDELKAPKAPTVN